MSNPERTSFMDAPAVERALDRMAEQIVAKVGGADRLVVLGIHRRGVHLAERLAERIRRDHAAPVPVGSLDITLYRDDLMSVGPLPVVGPTRVPEGGIGEQDVVVVDDVLFTGRTVRAALDELADFGRPRRTLLAVLVDRGGRELPIQADVVGATVEVPAGGRVEVRVPEIDGGLGAERIEAA